MIERSKSVLVDYAQRYDINASYDNKVETKLKKKLKTQNYLTRENFIEIGLWKSKRPRKHYESKVNSDKFVKELTSFAFRTKNERIKIEVLTLLNGCNYPLASVILHFKFPDHYSILDFRALWSLWGLEQPTKYNFELWWKYTQEVKKISKSLNIDIRTTDKALWRYSKENQLS